MSNLSQYTFQMFDKSDGKGLLRFDDTVSARAYPSIRMHDSILEFYPWLEVYVRDKQAVISEKIFFAEGLQIETKLGRETFIPKDTTQKDDLGGYISNTYGWMKNDINQTEIKNHISGDFIFFLTSFLYFKDTPRALAFRDSISNIAKNVIQDKKGFNFQIVNTNDNKNCFIGDTTLNKTTWYQAGRYGRFFLEVLASKAVSINFPNSPYLTFLNNRGEFYFMSISEMLSQQPICNYRIEETLTSIKDPYVIKDYTLHSGGAEINKKNYIKRFYKINSDGSISSSDNSIKNQKQIVHGKEGEDSRRDKLLIMKNNLVLSSIDNFGIFEDGEDLDVYNGWKNNFYIDSVLSYRMEIVVAFNPKLCAGKVITLTVDKLQEKSHASEYSGKWLIIQSDGHMDIDGLPFQRFLIGKAGIVIDSSHPLVGEYL